MTEAQIKLRDFRRAIEDFQAHVRELLRCDWGSWDAKIRGFQNFLETSNVIGTEIFSLVDKTQGDDGNSLFDTRSGSWIKYNPPDNIEDRLGKIGGLLLHNPAHKLAKIGLRLCGNTHIPACFDYVRTNIANEFFEVVETRLVRKLEDLQTLYHDDENVIIPVTQTLIFATNVAIATGGGDASITTTVTYNAGYELLEKRLHELKSAIEKVALEQERAAMAFEACDLTVNKKLEAIIAAVRSRDLKTAAGLWEEFEKTISVEKLGDAAGKTIDIVTLGFWVWNIAQGVPPNTGLG